MICYVLLLVITAITAVNIIGGFEFVITTYGFKTLGQSPCRLTTSWKRTGGDVLDDWSTRTPDAHLECIQFCWNSGQTKKLHTMPWNSKLSSQMCDRLGNISIIKEFEIATFPHLPGKPADPMESEFIEDSAAKAGLRAVRASGQRLWEGRMNREMKCAYRKLCSVIFIKRSSWTTGKSVATGNSIRLARGGLMKSVLDFRASKAKLSLHAKDCSGSFLATIRPSET